MTIDLSNANERSGACYEIIRYISNITEDLFTEKEDGLGKWVLFGNAFNAVEVLEEAVIAVAASRGPFAVMLLSAAGSLIELFSDVRQTRLVDMRADISTSLIDDACCDLYNMIEANNNIFTYDVLVQWKNYQISKNLSKGFRFWAEAAVKRIDVPDYWLRIAEIGAANPHGKAGVLCSTSQLVDDCPEKTQERAAEKWVRKAVS